MTQDVGPEIISTTCTQTILRGFHGSVVRRTQCRICLFGVKHAQGSLPCVLQAGGHNIDTMFGSCSVARRMRD